MSNTTKNNTVVEKDANSGGLILALHPLVLIHISDHWTRMKYQNNQENPRVIGVILGIQTGRNIEICTAWELNYSVKDGEVKIDQEYLIKKQEQFRKVFPKYEILGWYSTGVAPTAGDIEVHKQIMEANEGSLLYLLLDPVAAMAQKVKKELPVALFESELRVLEDKPVLLFAKVPFHIDTVDGERISLDHVAKVTNAGAAGPQLAAHLVGLHNAIAMLNSRVKTLQKFLAASQSGTVPRDHSLLRRVGELCHQLPAIDSTSFNTDFINEYNEALLITYLSSMTRGANSTNELVDKFNISFEKQSKRRGMGFMM